MGNIELDGHSLMPFLANGSSVNVYNDEVVVFDDFEAVKNRPNYVMSQFHGDEIHLSWFLLRQNEYKYVTYGSGKEVAPRLFNLVKDPDEMNDLANDSSYASLMQSMDKTSKTIID